MEQTAESAKTTVDDYINKMGTCVDITTAGLELRQRQDSEYYAMLTASSIDFKRRTDDVSVASFGANGAQIDRVRSNKVLSVGTKEDGWYDMTAMPGGVADKWRDGTSTSSQLKPIITRQPVDYYADFVTGSHSVTASDPWPETFTFSLDAENTASVQWQYRTIRDDLDWSDVSNGNQLSLTQNFSTIVINREYRCKLTGNDGSVVYSRAVRAYIKNAPVVVI